MGIKGFHKLTNPTNTSLQQLIKEHPLKNRIGIDTSVLIIKHLKSSSNAINRIHSKPLLPINSLGKFCCDIVRPMINNGFLVFMVFDGASHPLKANEHRRRYGCRIEKESKLNMLYSQTTQGTQLVNDQTLKEIYGLRKELTTIRPDMISTIITSLREAFKDKVFFIGAPFEADHQLGYLFKQHIIDYVFTVDGDIMAFGADVIKSLDSKGNCKLVEFEAILKDVPKALNIQATISKMTLLQLHHLACFLGNDYIDRVKGNGPAKAGNFIKAIADHNDEQKIYDDIKNAVKDISSEEREKKDFIKQWYNSYSMFSKGPVFVIDPTVEGLSRRDALVAIDNPFSVTIGQMDGNDNLWREDFINGSVNANLGRSLIVGWDPQQVFVDQLDESFKSSSRSESINDVYKRCAVLEIWSKKGNEISPLPLPTFGEKVMYHGSILDFDTIPINCFSLDDVKFFLSSRQVNHSQCNENEIYAHADKIWKAMGDQLQPIPKELMRGSGGYVTPQILTPRGETVNWFRNKELISVIQDLNLSIDNNSFTASFGKRNGTRRRIMHHLESGSYDVTQISATKDLCCENDEYPILVVQGGCTPSQRLKDSGGKNKVYDTRIVLKLDDTGKFMGIKPSPYSSCSCPNGCILCSHCGALYLLVYTLSKIGNENMSDVVNVLPEPINYALKAPILVEHIWPILVSEENRKKNAYKSERRRKSSNGQVTINIEDSQRTSCNDNEEDSTADDVAIYDELDEYVYEKETSVAIPGVVDASTTELFDIISKLDEWIISLKDGKRSNGTERQSAQKFHDYLQHHVDYKNSIQYKAVQLKVLNRVEIASC